MKKSNSSKGVVRIIAGEWRGRKLKFSDQQDLRPTPDRVRETVFNWLQFYVAGCRCLDLFAGSGALGFEAASRGAPRVTMVENNAAACADLQLNRTLLEAEQVNIVAQDAVQYLRQPVAEPFDLVFLDPPYRSDLLQLSASLLEQQHWLSNHAKIYVEANAGLAVAELLPDSWRCLKSSSAGQIAYSLYQRSV
jgi:16S rRNA (guanine966-N2)-methyltransferase